MLRILPNNVLLCACGMCVCPMNTIKFWKLNIGILIGTLTWNCNVFTVCVVCVYVPLEFALDC